MFLEGNTLISGTRFFSEGNTLISGTCFFSHKVTLGLMALAFCEGNTWIAGM